MITNYTCDFKIDLGSGEAPNEYAWSTILENVPVFATLKPQVITIAGTTRQISNLSVIMDIRYLVLIAGNKYNDLHLLCCLKTPKGIAACSYWVGFIVADNDSNIRLELTPFDG